MRTWVIVGGLAVCMALIAVAALRIVYPSTLRGIPVPPGCVSDSDCPDSTVCDESLGSSVEYNCIAGMCEEVLVPCPECMTDANCVPIMGFQSMCCDNSCL